jgi:site-specific DNA-methyltransferase (adenine-specific)
VNKLYFGDNLTVLRDHVNDESIDLVYLDPPFKSDANYNVLFKGPGGEGSHAQAEAFKDTWEWGESAAAAYDDVMAGNGDVALVLSGFRKWLGENGMMAYLSMMAIRLIELHRKLKDNGSLYLHCDPTASHYLKLMLDALFGHKSFRNEIIWCYTGPGSPGVRQFLRKHDNIFWYSKGDTWTFNVDDIRVEHSEKTKANYKQGLLGSGFVGADHVIHEKGKVPEDWWQIAIAPRGREYLGYPTQKPIKLLNRIVAASCPENGTVLDPFCGCGTTVEAAQALGRKWIGIDVTHYAVTLIEERLKRVGTKKDSYQVSGRPTDLEGANNLALRDKHQFQWWAAWCLGAQTYREEKRGADRGIDGNIFFRNGPYGDGRIIISVKGGENVGVAMVRDLRGVIEREDAQMGVLVTLVEPTGPMKSEAAAAGFVAKSAHGRLPRLQIVTVEEMLDGKMPKFPPLPIPDRTRARVSTKKKGKEQIELLLPFENKKIVAAKGEYLDPRFIKFG